MTIKLNINEITSSDDDSLDYDDTESEECCPLLPCLPAAAAALPAALLPAEIEGIFIPKPKVSKSLVGNVKDANVEELKKFLSTISSSDSKFIITREFGKSKENEHLHFYVESTDIQIETVKKKLRENSYYKKLKRKEQGGDHKYSIKVMAEMIQFHYIFKECDLQNLSEMLYFDGFNISPSMVKGYQSTYLSDCQHKKLSASQKFYKWVENKHSVKTFARISVCKKSLISEYLDFSLENNRSVINRFDCEKMVNYIILRTNPELLREEFIRSLCGD